MIGVFDSGYGGLHVLRGLRDRLPHYRYVYLGDNARAPYGPRSHEEIYTFTKQGVEFLFDHGVDLVVLACNTASSESLRIIQADYRTQPEKKVIGVLVPFSEAAAEATRLGVIGVMATEATVRSGAYEREIRKLRPDAHVIQQACPALVPLVESGKHETPEMKDAIESYLLPLLKRGVDTLVLGCTHYGLIEQTVRSIAGDDVRVISEKDALEGRFERYLIRHPEIQPDNSRDSGVEFYSTAAPEDFAALGSIFFGEPIIADRVVLG